jgi:Mg2+-importing ATPase
MAGELGMPADRVISGKDLYKLDDTALMRKLHEIDVFAETEPFQKQRIVRVLRQAGHVVGYLGDGINDAPALKAADVSVSVHNAADVARESADIILLEKSLDVMQYGIEEGRKTYQNTLKYIFITISANFGNMFSLAGASLLIPFLPLLPSQVLLTNLISDFPVLALASDSVDPEMLLKPQKWDVSMTKKFMIIFGLESSVFDLLTFAFLYWIYKASTDVFRTGWFVESVITEILILLIIRTHRTFGHSSISRLLLLTSVGATLVVLTMPYIPLMRQLGFAPLPWYLLLSILGIALLYGFIAEITKKIIFRKMKY